MCRHWACLRTRRPRPEISLSVQGGLEQGDKAVRRLFLGREVHRTGRMEKELH